jgi:hypothetical protein
MAVLQGSSSQSRKINCKWRTISRSCCVHPCGDSAGNTRELVTTMLSSEQRDHQDQDDRLSTHCSVSPHSIMWVPLTLSGKSPTMPRALCDLLAAELALHLPLVLILVLLSSARPPNAEQRASAKARCTTFSQPLESSLAFPIACSQPLGSPCYLRCANYYCWL